MGTVITTTKAQALHAAIHAVLVIGILVSQVAYWSTHTKYADQSDVLKDTQAKLAQAELTVKVLHAQSAEQRVQGLITGMEMECRQ